MSTRISCAPCCPNCGDCVLVDAYNFDYPSITIDAGYGCTNATVGCPEFEGNYTLDYQGVKDLGLSFLYWWQSAIFENEGCDCDFIWQMRIQKVKSTGVCTINLYLGRAANLENNTTVSVYDMGAPAIRYPGSFDENCDILISYEGDHWLTCLWEDALPFVLYAQ